MDYEEVKRKIRDIARLSNYAINLLPLMNSIDQLEAKAQELDRREKGALVVAENVLGVDFLMCSNCGALAGNKYCDHCGFKLIFPESEALDE